MEDQIKSAKEKFLTRYNTSHSIEKAKSLAIRAAVQHNSLYHENTSIKDKSEVRDAWGKKLMKLSEKYSNKITTQDYYLDISELKDYMNKNFGVFFKNEPHLKYGYDPGFRISHSQKSLSVFLKHLWCMELIANPPQCPVDRIILTHIGQKSKNASWGYINTIEEHHSKIRLLEEFIKPTTTSLSIWELLIF